MYNYFISNLIKQSIGFNLDEEDCFDPDELPDGVNYRCYYDAEIRVLMCSRGISNINKT